MKKECEQFKLDLTDYAGGDISQIADMKAFEKHLKTCADCRTELNKLRKTLGVLVAGESHSERLQKKISVLKQQIIRKDTYDLKRLIQANKIKEAISLIVKQYIIKNHTEKLSLFERTFDGIYENIKAQGMSHIEDRQKITGLSKEAAFIPHGQTPTLLGSIIATTYYFIQKVTDQQGESQKDSNKYFEKLGDDFVSYGAKAQLMEFLVNLVKKNYFK